MGMQSVSPFTVTSLGLSLVGNASGREFVDFNIEQLPLCHRATNTPLFSLKIQSQRKASGNEMSSTASTHR